MVTIQCHQTIFPNVQAILFDKDGTLANSEAYLNRLGNLRCQYVEAQVPGVGQQLKRAFGLETGGVPGLNPAGMLAVASRRDNEIAAGTYIAATGRNWIESLKLAIAAFQESEAALGRKADHTPPLAANLAELLARLRLQGLKLGILSADTPENVVDFARRYGLEPYVQLLMGEEPGLTKPNPEVLYTACERLQVPLSATLMVGDSAADISMAKAAGVLGAIGITWGWTQLPPPLNADVTIAHLDELQVAEPWSTTLVSGGQSHG